MLSALAVAGIAGASLLLLALPAVIAVRVLAPPVEWVAAGATFLGAGLVGVKLIAMAWGIGERLVTAHRAWAVVPAD